MKKIILFTIVLVAFARVHAQVGINTENPSPNSALQIVSPTSNQGLLVPQLTTADVESISIATTGGTPSDPTSINEDGLVVFNSQTGCFNYWKQETQQWYSLCGTPPPAVVEIDNCAAIKATGIYIENQAFTVNNYIQLPVHVIRAGTCTITAVTTDNGGNGYYFSTSSIFPASGYYTVNLAGAGMPLVPNTSPGNPIVFSLNGENSPATCFNLPIQTAKPDYVITGVTQMPSNPWSVGSPLDDGTYFIQVTLRVNKPGHWQLTANTQNGYAFNGNGELSEASGYNPTGTFPQIVTVNVSVSSGQANVWSVSGDAFTLSTVGSATPSNYPFIIRLAGISFTISDCNAITLNNAGTLTQEVAIPAGMTITVPITVTASGFTKITAIFAGLTFVTHNASNNPGETNLAAGQTSVTLYPATAGQKPNQAGEHAIQFSSSEGGLVIACTQPKKVTVVPAVAAFNNITFISTSYNAVYISDPQKNIALQVPEVTLSVQTNVAGNYSLTTTINGVTYSGKGSVPTGSSSIMLFADRDINGNPVSQMAAASGPKIYILTYPKLAGTGSLNFTINFCYRKMNILSWGNRGSGFDRMFPSTTDVSAANLMLQKTGNFGPAGKVGVGGFNIINIGTTSNANTLKNTINSNKIDIIFITSNNEISNDALAQVIYDFINIKKGVVIFASQLETGTERLLNKLYGAGTFDAPFSAGQTRFAINTALAANDPILYGPFTLPGYDWTGKYIGDDCSNGTRIRNFSALPASVKKIAIWTGNSSATCPTGAVFAFYDDNKGFFYCGDWAWANGRTTYNSSTAAWPNTQNDGEPIVKNNMIASDGITAGPVYNSFIYANVMAWAIDKAANRTLVDVQVP